jgi:peptidoglycan/xylan/chitin deacetylase (PgdA/CDA1 family)
VNGAQDWPGGARGALSLTFDNLGEAAELELGAIGADTPLGRHFTTTRVLPTLLDELAARGLAATFFVEGLNTELYPDELATIDGRGHEIGYHAWRHEQWADLSGAEQMENLARGLTGFRDLGLEATGLRPPGGLLGPGGLDVLREAGLHYCSPAGAGAGEDNGIALLPFQWRHVDASCVLPPLTEAREQMTGSPDPVDPGAFLATLGRALDELSRDGGYLSIVLHLSMLDWLGEERLGVLLDRAARAAAHVLTRPGQFRDETVLDPTSWTNAAG